MAGSKLPSTLPISAPKIVQYSTLEVDHARWHGNDGKAGSIVSHYISEDKIVYYDDGKMASYDNGKITNYNDVGKESVAVNIHKALPDFPHSAKELKVFGLRRKTVLILALVGLVVIMAAALGVGVGVDGAVSRRKRTKAAAGTTNFPPPAARYANTGLAAMQWTDLNGTLHKRLYYQDNSDRIREAAWENNTVVNTDWGVNVISDVVKPGTPIAAVAGYPHASFKYSLVKNVYYMSTDYSLLERQAPSNDSQAWEDDNFSGLYTGSDSTFLTAHWNQNIRNQSEELVVLFQDENFANGITQGRYTSNRTTSNPWIANNFGFSQPKGSTFAMSLVSYRSGRHLMLYTVGDGDKLKQHEYTISNTCLDSKMVVSLTSESDTGLTVKPRSPLAVVAQDNQPLFAADKLPECVHQTPLTHLILFAAADRNSLVLNVWNCTSGFVDHTPEIKPLQKPNTIYLSLAAMSDKMSGNGNLYIMFDTGKGPQVEEWTVPSRAGDPWVKSNSVTTHFD